MGGRRGKFNRKQKKKNTKQKLFVSSWCDGKSQGYLDRSVLGSFSAQPKEKSSSILWFFFAHITFVFCFNIGRYVWAIITFLWVPRANFETQTGKHDYITVSTLHVLYICILFYFVSYFTSVLIFSLKNKFIFILLLLRGSTKNDCFSSISSWK